MTAQPQDQRTRPRKQPRQARAQHTVNAIIEASARILEEQGHGGFTTNAVAELAGASIGTLYQYFPDKDALLGALIARETSRLVEEVEAASMVATGRGALDGVIEAAVRHQVRRPRLARLLDFEEARLPLDADTQLVRAKIVTLLADVLSRPDLPRQSNMPSATGDVLAIIRGMLDAAGERGEEGQAPLIVRVRRAVLGYLSMPDSVEA
ncbi:TetR/AcrR family transcriptional regulator [Roseomonas sp. 573]|uniref:TetR/AcrR family transcriptional regulator n=1 Tax=Roseomonas haemaphysalidis TaxID=2768162 RepID=A0ABS3KW02_9PROT|nr:TetR/AcrR family transcriptional regulator [Roseomonas haemaphysalidis]